MVKITTKLFSDVGMDEIFMSRLIHFQGHILNGLFCGKIEEEIKDAIMKVLFDGLEPAFRSLRNLRKKCDDPKVSEKEKRQLVENIFSYLVIAFKDRFQDVTKKMGYNIGFLFQQQKDFKKGCEKFIQQHPKINLKNISTIKETRAWLCQMIDVRNKVIEHKTNDKDCIKRLNRFLNLETSEVLFVNCWRTIEIFLAIFANDLIKPEHGIKILELSAYVKNKDNFERFGWFDITK